MRKLKYDEIGYWSEVKLEIVRKYASAYSTILSKQQYIKRHLYIDAFAGAGVHISKHTGDFVPTPMPMRNSRGAIVYYLFFASPNKTGGKIIADIFKKYKNRGQL